MLEEEGGRLRARGEVDDTRGEEEEEQEEEEGKLFCVFCCGRSILG